MPRPIFEVENLGVAVNDLDAARKRTVHGVKVEPYGRMLPYGWVEAITDVSFSVQPGEVLVSRTLTDLVAGSGLRFEDRGEHELKGIAEKWQLFAAAN